MVVVVSPPQAMPAEPEPSGGSATRGARATLATRWSLADDRLLGFLAKAGKLGRAAMEAAKNACQSRGVSALEFLAEGGTLSAEQIASALADGLGLRWLRLTTMSIDEWVAELVDETSAARFGLLPVAAEDDSVTVAMANPFDQEAIKYVEFATGRRVRRAVCTRADLRQALPKAYGHESTLAAVLADVPESESVELLFGASTPVAAVEAEAAALARSAEQPSIVKMANLLLSDAMGAEASDVHIEPSANVVLVRYRIDGTLVDAHRLPKWVQSPLAARLKTLAKADLRAHHAPQEGQFGIRHEGRLVDVRVSVLPTTDGEKFVLRLRDPSRRSHGLSQLGFREPDLAKIRAWIRRPEGIVIVTGPTGNGKTATLYAMVEDVVAPERNVVSIEDPVESPLNGVSQVTVDAARGVTFAAVLRSALQQDPDVILVGELNDPETATVAFHAARTGHLVLSSSRANDASTAIARLLALGVEPQVVATSLLAVISQRLVRKVCERCAEPAVAEVPALQSRERGLRQGKGCSACRGTGFAGRTLCYEALEISPQIRRRIESGVPAGELRMLAEEEGMVSLRANALAMVESGVTTTDEAMRVIQIDDPTLQCPQCLNPVEERFTTCPYCRTPLRFGCPRCGMTLKPEWASCPYCAAAVPADRPAARANGAASRAVLPAIELASGAREKPRILVVDDYADVRMLVRAALQVGGDVVVQEAESGAEALALIEKERPHLVILDLMMPEMDGYEVCRRLRSSLKTAFLPILMLTALSDTKSKSLGFLAGTDDYLVKPFENAELRSRVAWLLQRAYRLASAANAPGKAAAAPAPGPNGGISS